MSVCSSGLVVFSRPKYSHVAGATQMTTRPKSREKPDHKASAALKPEGRDPAGGKGSRGVKAYELLRQAIATGQLKPGDRVLENELASWLNMSRTPVREAIATLEADGLVTMNGAQGRVVTKLDYQSV